MSGYDCLRLPSGVQVLFIVMVWPAIWAAALITMALISDVIRHARPPASAESRRAA